MTELTVAQIDEQIDALNAAITTRLTSGVRTKITYSDGGVEKTIGSVEEIRQQIALLEMKRAKLTGKGAGGAIRVGFGSRI